MCSGGAGLLDTMHAIVLDYDLRNGLYGGFDGCVYSLFLYIRTTSGVLALASRVCYECNVFYQSMLVRRVYVSCICTLVLRQALPRY